MQQVLLTCADENLRRACQEVIGEVGCSLHWVPSGESALEYIQQHQVDLVILHSDAADRDCFTILEVLRSFRPDVSIVLTSHQFDYWNNFMTWLADECLVTTPDLDSLRDAVRQLLSSRRPAAVGAETSRFAVDWE